MQGSFIYLVLSCILLELEIALKLLILKSISESISKCLRQTDFDTNNNLIPLSINVINFYTSYLLYPTSLMLWRILCRCKVGSPMYQNIFSEMVTFFMSIFFLILCQKKIHIVYNSINCTWFHWVLWHFNHCRLFNAKSSLYIYIKYIGFGLGFMAYQPL